MSLEIIGIHLKHDIDEGDALVDLVPTSDLLDGDILVISQKMVSKQEGRVVPLYTVFPSELAVGLASAYDKDPCLVELVLSETRRIVRLRNGVMICETRHGLVCANAGVDASNVPEGHAALLPVDPDASARKLCGDILKKTGFHIPVIISDTFGRPFRTGQTDCAIGVYGMDPLLDYAGEQDMLGRELRVTAIAVADELCAAAELAAGKAARIPMVIVRNYLRQSGGNGNAGVGRLLRDESLDLFR